MKSLYTLRCLAAVSLLFACKAPQSPTPNSPLHDHQPPATSPGSGDVIGADGVPPAQKLEEGPKVDSEKGAAPADKPRSD